ncbi:MAG: hypothetical protein KDD84_16970, partial [Caldilineaceae bacterium]|nr:hypothetical protein [Caldilineaceae bacterium]
DVGGVDTPVEVSGGVLVISGPDQPAEAVIRLDPAHSEIAPGQLAAVGVQLDVTAARPVVAATMLLQYDPQIVRPVQCTAAAGSTVQGTCNINFNRTQGLIKFNLLAVEGAVGLLDLYDVMFEAVGTAVSGAVSPLMPSIESIVDAQSTPLHWRAEDGSLTVGASSTNAAQLRVGDAQSNGQWTLEHGAEITVPVWVVDVANLGAATIELSFDAALLEPLGCTMNTATAGLDGGQCVIEQDRVLAQIVAGQGFSGSAALFEVVFSPRTGAPAGETSPLLPAASTFADVNAAPLPWRAINGEITLLPGAPSNAPLIELDALVTAPPQLTLDGQVTVTLRISGAVNVGAATVAVGFDPAVVRLASCAPNTAFDGAVCVMGDGEARVTLLAGNGFSGPAALAKLVFRAADSAEVGTQADLAVSVANFSDVEGNTLRYQVANGALQIAEAANLARDVLLQVAPTLVDVLPGRRFEVQLETRIDTFKLPQGLDVVTLRLLYDPAVVRPVGCAHNVGGFLGGGCNPTYEDGQIRLTLVGGVDATQQTNLAQIQFDAIGQTDAETTLRLAVDALLDADSAVPSHRTQPARVTITRDGDGVSDAVEGGAPNNGDGNNDGVADAEQSHVTSLPSPVTGHYVTLVGPPTSCLIDVRFLPNPSSEDTPAGWSAELGFIGFTLGCLPPGSNASVTTILHGDSGRDLNQFYIYASNQTAAATGWQPFLLEGGLGASFTADGFVLQLGDGARGDNDAAANGAIDFLGAPGRSGVAIGVEPRSLVIAPSRAGTYDVVLLARPLAPVLIGTASGGRAVASPEQLIFTLDNWSAAQTVTVRSASGIAVPNTDLIEHSVASADAAYNGLVIDGVSIVIEEDDDPTPTATPTPTPTTPTPTTPTPTPAPPQISRIEPNQGIGSVANEVTIFGANLRAETQISIADIALTDIALTDYTVTDQQGTLALAVAPRGLAPGVYDVRAVNPGSAVFTLTDGYTVIDESMPDLSAGDRDIWLSPVTVRLGAAATIGVNVHRAGGDETLPGVDVAFYLNEISSGALLGRQTTASFAPGNDVIASAVISWTPPAAGVYTVIAVIDPDGTVTEGAETNNTARWTFEVLQPSNSEDTTPPVVTAVTAGGGVQSTTQQEISLEIDATDDDSGVYSMYIVERVYNNAARAWVIVQESGWIPYATPYTLRLSPVAGVHYIRVWVADAAGNVSDASMVTVINYLPAVTKIRAGQVRVYRLNLAAGNLLSVAVTPSSGDADVYIWDEDSLLVAYSNLDDQAADPVAYTASRAGIYQIEIHGYDDGEYGMTLTPGMERATSMPSAKVLPTGPAVSPRSVPPTQQALPPAPVAAPSAISLVSFGAAYRDGAVRVTWATGWERDTLGFHIYRSDTNAFATAARITDQLIPGVGGSSGAPYTVIDAAAQPAQIYWYWLVEREFSGATNIYGPTSVTVATSTDLDSAARVYLPLL